MNDQKSKYFLYITLLYVCTKDQKGWVTKARSLIREGYLFTVITVYMIEEKSTH